MKTGSGLLMLLAAISLAAASVLAQSNGGVVNLAGAGATCLSDPAQMANLERERALLSRSARRDLNIVALPEDQAEPIERQGGFQWCASCASASKAIWVCIGDYASASDPGGSSAAQSQPGPMMMYGQSGSALSQGDDNNRAQANSLVQGERWHELLDFTNRWMQTNQNSAQAWFFRGLAYENLNNQTQAESDFGQAVRLDPHFGPAQFGLGRTLMRRGSYQQAIAPLESATRVMPNNARASSDLGVALTHSGRPQEAIPVFERAMRLDPDDIGGVGLAAEAYILSGNWARGAELLERAIKKQPFDAVNIYWMQELGGAYNRMGNYHRSEQVFEASLQYAGNDPNTWQYLWQDYLKTGDAAKAQQAKANLDRLTEQGQMPQAGCPAGSVVAGLGRCVGIPDLLRNEQRRRQQN